MKQRPDGLCGYLDVQLPLIDSHGHEIRGAPLEVQKITALRPRHRPLCEEQIVHINAINLAIGRERHASEVHDRGKPVQ